MTREELVEAILERHPSDIATDRFFSQVKTYKTPGGNIVVKGHNLDQKRKAAADFARKQIVRRKANPSASQTLRREASKAIRRRKRTQSARARLTGK